MRRRCEWVMVLTCFPVVFFCGAACISASGKQDSNFQHSYLFTKSYSHMKAREYYSRFHLPSREFRGAPIFTFSASPFHFACRIHTMADTSTTTSSSLTRVLALATPLHENGSLSLQQLVPVHASLIQASHVEDTVAVNASSLDDAVKDNAVARQILAEGTESQKLLLLQYLMQASGTFSSLQALASFVLPFFMQERKVSEDLREALLDAVFTNTSSAPTKYDLLACLDACQQVTSNSNVRHWTTLSRMLVRLYTNLGDAEPQQEAAEFIHTKVVQGIQVALESRDYLKVLHPLVTWLLPLLFQDEAIPLPSERADELWTCLLGSSLADSGQPKNQQVALVVSAVLCSILPFLLTKELPVVSNDPDGDSPQQRARPVQQESLWKLILYSLQQGMDATSASLAKGGYHQSQQHVSLDQMLRRRGLYLLRLLVQDETPNNQVWLKYVLCFEALEMETEPHLVDQVWDTVAQVCSAIQQCPSITQELPRMTWDWISAMLARILLSETPILQKLGLYRSLSGHAGISVSANKDTNGGDTDKKQQQSSLMTPGQKRHGIKSKKKKGNNKAATPAVPITTVSQEFVLKILIPSYDIMGQSLGTNMNFEQDGRIEVQDVTPLLESFLRIYMSSLSLEGRREFLIGLFSRPTVCALRLKTTVMVYEAVASVDVDLAMDQDLLQTAVQSFGALFSGSSIVAVYRERLMMAFATMLSNSSSTDPVNPEVLLQILALYPIPSNTTEDSPNVFSDDPKCGALQEWLGKLGASPSWLASHVGASCASAFVMGQLFPTSSEWTPEAGSSETERLMGGAIVLLCALAAASEESNASQLLWPAIYKGLASVPQGAPWYNADRTSRGLILLVDGCRLGLTSGVGNGDLVMDKSQQMMPPPPNIELLLSNAVDFNLSHIEALTSLEGVPSTSKSGGARSGITARVSSTVARLVDQMKVLCNSYPSSLAVSNAADKMLDISMKKLSGKDMSVIEVVQNTALAFGALSCGADATGNNSSVEMCRLILNLSFPRKNDGSVSNVQTARSIFQYAKWGTLSYLLRALLYETDSSGDSASDRSSFLSELFDVAEDSVYATPAEALLPLFDCVVMGARSWLSTDKEEATNDIDLYTKNLKKIISSLFVLKSEVESGRPAIYMLNEICALLFRAELLMDEYERVLRDGDNAATPIRDAFRQLMEMAGSTRPHISRIALSYISVAWLGDDASRGSPGLSAIPYRTDLCQLLLHKEVKLEQSSAVQQADIIHGSNPLPSADDTSVSRAFVLIFLSRLPEVNGRLSTATLTNLLHFMILHLLDDVCLAKTPGGKLLISGSLEYSNKIRAWQGLCVLSRFVTDTIASPVCDKVFECMGQNLHGQIRYFVEAFAIQCARRHPAIFGRKLVAEIRRKDLTLQNISSLMIIGGNLLVGRYKDDFFSQFDSGDEDAVSLNEILAGVIPWLSSTQGFTRAISQLLVHKLIPLVIDINDDSVEAADLQDSDWFLKSIYRFLEENPEMKRLRKKQSKFFERYDLDEICSAQALLQLGVDEGNEANPEHLVEAIKKCLEQVYIESHEHETPQWKQVADLMNSGAVVSEDSDATTDNELVNFQRKIVPLDSLSLELDASRNARLKNAIGRKKQSLVVVASLVDKVPNLAGLARTSEIFAAERLVIPDKSVCRMDNFKSISVTAGDWLDIEGCKEDVSVPFLFV